MKNNTITIQSPTLHCGEACENILRALPDWFGIEKSLRQYVKDADKMSTMLAIDGKNIIGFLTINKHFMESAEIHCMGILPKYHRKGIGKLLIKELVNYLRNDDIKILQVKTVSKERECPAYAKTRAFYKAVGFIPLEVFPNLWDKANPCLLLVKQI